jgi:hypothetical protein
MAAHYGQASRIRERDMTPEQILGIPPRLLTQKQREFYFENGYLLLEKLLCDDWIVRLRQATQEMVEMSRSITKSDATWGPR